MPQSLRAALDAKLCDAVQSATHSGAWRGTKSGNVLPGDGKHRPRAGLAPGQYAYRPQAGNLKRHEIDSSAGMQLAPLLAMNTTPLVFCALALASLARIAGAAAMVDPATINAAAESAVRAQAGASANLLTLEPAALDPRLRVAPCDRALTGFLTNSSSLSYQTTVGVRCEGSVRWTIYTSVRVETQAPVLVARRSLARNAEITAADFKLETRRVPGILSAYVTDLAALAGQRLSRPLAADEPLSFEALAPANLIHRGQAVVLLAHSGSLEVRMNGIALADGRASERIRVQNVSSQRVVEGIVRSESVVEAPL
jgi:flagella basal body P-ring formation protein FlgA